jgi:hypothetical protein
MPARSRGWWGHVVPAPAAAKRSEANSPPGNCRKGQDARSDRFSREFIRHGGGCCGWRGGQRYPRKYDGQDWGAIVEKAPADRVSGAEQNRDRQGRERGEHSMGKHQKAPADRVSGAEQNRDRQGRERGEHSMGDHQGQPRWLERLCN